MSSRLPPLVTLALVLLLLLLPPSMDAVLGHNKRFPNKATPCCVEVSSQDISSLVTGSTYRVQSARKHCVHAIILKTTRGSVCVDPHCKWVRDIIADMKKQ